MFRMHIIGNKSKLLDQYDKKYIKYGGAKKSTKKSSKKSSKK